MKIVFCVIHQTYRCIFKTFPVTKKVLTVIFLTSSLFLEAQEEVKTDSIQGTPVTLDEVSVSAVRVNTQSPVTHSNLTKKELEKRNLGQDIPVLINLLPSVVSTTDAGAGIGYTGFRVRGVGAQGTNVTINGIPYNDAESLLTFWVNLPDLVSSTQSLQLQRGVGTSTNGSGAFGASLNLLTDVVSDHATGEIANAVGSYHTRKHTAKFSTGKLNNRWEIAGRLSAIRSDGYIDRARADLDSHFLQASYSGESTLIKALTFGGHEVTYQAWNGIDMETLNTNRRFNPSGMYTDNSGAVKFYDNEVDDYKQDHYQIHWNQQWSDTWSTNLGLNYTYGRGFFEQYKEDQSLVDYGFSDVIIGEETIGETDLIRRRWLDNDFYVVNANANYKKKHLELIIGAFFSTYTGDHFGEIIWGNILPANLEIRDRYYESDSEKNEWSYFAKLNLNLNDTWRLFGDIQHRLVNYKTTGLTSDRVPININESYNFFNPKMGVTYIINDAQHLYASYGRAHKEPSRDDFENGSPEPEKLDDFELGWRYKKPGISFNANVYYMHYKDQLVYTGAINDVGAPVRMNSGKSYRLGLELESGVKISDKVSMQVNTSISSNKNSDFITPLDGTLVNLGNTHISFSPGFVGAGTVDYQPTENFRISWLSKYVGSQYMGNVDASLSKLDAYFINDLNVNYEINTNSFFKSITLTALVNNIFNVKYVSNGYYYTYDDTWTNPGVITTIEGAGFYPQATTNFLFGVNVKL